MLAFGLVTLILATLGATSNIGPLAEPLPAEPVETPSIEFSQPPAEEPAGPPLDPDDFNIDPIAPWLGDLLNWLGIIAAAGLALWFLVRVIQQVGPRLKRRAAPAAGTAIEVPEIDEREIITRFDEAIVSLREGASVDDVVVEAWRQLEALAARAGIERGPTQTTEEFTVRVLGGSGVAPDDLATLAGLYRRAMFSTHALTDAHRADALACLERMRACLEQDRHAH